MRTVRETQGSIVRWQRETFPGAAGNIRTYARRMFQEAVELCLSAGIGGGQLSMMLTEDYADWSSGGGDVNLEITAQECADVLIVLYGVADAAGVDLHEQVDRKMQVNRARRWRINEDGSGQHE